MISCELIQQITGFPKQNIDDNWPAIFAEMEKAGHATLFEQIGMIATIATETNVTVNKVKQGFKAIHELGGPVYFEDHYGYNTRCGKGLGNTSPGDGSKYHGRGHIQCTGKANYALAAKKFGVDYVTNPDLMLIPSNSAKFAVDYFNTRKVFKAALNQDWEHVRKYVNGGTNGWDYFKKIVDKLLELSK